MKRILCSVFCLLALHAATAETSVKPLAYNNPELEVELGVGLWGIPIPWDADGDGKKDLIVVCPDTPYRGTYLFRNIGTPEKPFFDRAVKIGSKISKNVRYSEYDGRQYVSTPGYLQMNFASAPFEFKRKIEYEGERIGEGYKKSRSNMWNHVDWDGDGDMDIIVGIDTWDDYGWDNAYDENGKWKNGPLHGYLFLLENVDGKYINRGKIEAGGKVIDTFGAPCPCIADFDGDGDLDIICGEFRDRLTWFENTGSRTDPELAAGRALANADGEIRFHIQMIVPVATDFDGDGKTDLLVSDEDGTVSLLHNTGQTSDHMPRFLNPQYLKQKADLVKFGALSTPCLYDWDGDGLLDIVTGNSAGEIALIRCLKSGKETVWDAPKLFRTGGKPFRIMAGENGSIQGPAECKWGYTVVSVADWDGDGKADIIASSIFGRVIWLKNLGSEDGLELAEPQSVKVEWTVSPTPKVAWNWWNPEPQELVTQWRTTPLAIDWNRDGITDLVTLDHEGYLSYYRGFMNADGEKMLKPGQRIFSCINGSVYDNKLGITDSRRGTLRLNDSEAGQSGRRKFCFADWDGDRKLDLIVDGKNAVWFSYLGTDANGKVWFEFMGDIAERKLEGHTTCPTPLPKKNSKFSDILLGAEDGHFYVVKNPK